MKSVNARLTSTVGGTATATLSIGAGKLKTVMAKITAGSEPLNNWDLTVTDSNGLVGAKNTAISNGTANPIIVLQSGSTACVGSITLNAVNMGTTNVADIICYVEED